MQFTCPAKHFEVKSFLVTFEDKEKNYRPSGKVFSAWFSKLQSVCPKELFEEKYAFEKKMFLRKSMFLRKRTRTEKSSGICREFLNGVVITAFYVSSGTFLVEIYFEENINFLSFLVIERNTFDCSSICIGIGLSNLHFTCPEKHFEGKRVFWILCTFCHFWRFREKFPAFSKKLSVSVVISPF